MNHSSTYIAILLGSAAVLVVFLLFFMNGLGQVSYLVYNGIEQTLQKTDLLRYELNLLGVVYTLVLILAALLLVVFFMLGDAHTAGAIRSVGVPNTRERNAGVQRHIELPPSPVVPERVVAAPEVPAAVRATREAETAKEPETPALLPRRAARPEKRPTAEELDLPALENFQSRYHGEEDDDVIYGNGRITEDALWDFVQNHPDSAIKFLYRKNLDNKPLPPIEEDIYRNWELRGMRRIHIRSIILSVMGWKTLPEDFPHNLWQRLRNRLLDLKRGAQAPPTSQSFVRSAS